ncbi:MAG: rhomboid family intramembrane serine protease [Chitinophagales bacterium]|nr:rhomboid family intramembrane serine protease [Bacteroidota bacterium]MBK8683196.1 rhomboid family intramembrane serine protease [Bacteroidota bacterium]
MTQFGMQRFNFLPPVIKNLLIINGLVFLATLTFPSLIEKLAMYYPTSPEFQPYQIITHLFTHGSFGHVFFNMFALWMFGAVLENVWGGKRFLIYYFITGIGATLLYTGVHAIQLYQITGSISPDILKEGYIIGNYSESNLSTLRAIFSPLVGASGAVYGVLLAYGMLFPNTLIYIYFLLPLKAKYLVMILTAIELYMGFINNPADNVAHFAHLGGMLVGFVLIKYWQKSKTKFY